MDGVAGLWPAPSGRGQLQQGKTSRFHVRKLYDRLHLEVKSHMETGNSEVAVSLIRSQRTEVNNVDETGLTLLMTACCHGDLVVVQTLLEEGANVDAADNDLWTPLLYASRDGHVEIVKELLDSGADFEKRDVGGWTALMWSCYKGRHACIKELINKGANVNIKAMHNMTCLHWAAGRGHTECVTSLLEAGAKVDATDKYGSTPLIWAGRKGFLTIVESLLKRGASADAVGMYSWTPLLVALQGGHTRVAKMILGAQPNLNATDKDGMTALALAAKAGYDDILTELLNQGAYLNTADKSGDTVLHHATKGGHTDIAKLLLRRNPDIDARGQDGKTVLYLAVEKGNAALVKTLLANDPDKELTDKDGNTPLLRAVRNRNCEMAYLLVEKGAKVSAVDVKGDTSLHIAMRARNRRMLELLLKNPSNSRYLYIRNSCGQTPYSIDSGNKRSLLSHIFGARSLNSQEAVESQLGYEHYSSSLADILSSPTLNTPMTVGLFAKWGSGKSFMLKKLKEDMQAYMKQSPTVQFEFSWLIFFLNITVGLVAGLLLAAATQQWKVGLSVGASILVMLYTLQAVLFCLERKKNWDWVVHISHTCAKKIQKLRLLLYMLFYNRPPAHSNDTICHSISFVFAESTKLTSLGGEHSLASMIGSLFDALEKRYGVMVTRLYKVFGSDRERKARLKKLCCIPYIIIVVFVLLCLITLIGLYWAYNPINTNPQAINIVMLVLVCIVGLSLLLSLHNIGKAIAAYAYSPKRRTTKASKALDASKSDNFLHVLKTEVELLSSLVTTMDRHESWQTRLVLIIDGLDSCEQDKVLQVLDAINLVIPENSPFIILLALDPHVIVKGIEANQLQALRDQSLNGYGYLKNIVHLPFYLQNHSLPRMYTASESAQLRRWQNAPSQSKHKGILDRQPSVMSSTVSLEQNTRPKQRRRSLPTDSLIALEPLHNLMGEMPKNIMKNDYFVDINPRSMRRLMNIIAMAGRLLRANDVDFSWYRLSAWINITEQWPYRTSWMLLYYEEMDGKLDDTLTLLSIYEKISDRIPVHREMEPLLDIDRNEKKLIAFLKSHVPRLNVDDIKKFIPATINLDPFLRKLIKEKSRDLPDNTSVTATSANGYYQPRFPFVPQAPPTMYSHPLNSQTSPLGTQAAPVSTPRRHKLPKDIAALSAHTVSDICDLLHKIKGMSTLNLDTYKTAILLHNINGAVLADCDLGDLKSVLQMKFGDWQLFRSTILAMREVDIPSQASSIQDLAARPPSRGPLPVIPSQIEVGEFNQSGNCSVTSSYCNSPLLSRATGKFQGESGQKIDDTVMLENQMIMSAVHDQLALSDDEDSNEGQQNTVTDLSQLSAELSQIQLQRHDDGLTEPRSVKFFIVNEAKDAGNVFEPLVHDFNSPRLTHGGLEHRSSQEKLRKSGSMTMAQTLPVIEESSGLEKHQDIVINGLDNPAFHSLE